MYHLLALFKNFIYFWAEHILVGLFLFSIGFLFSLSAGSEILLEDYLIVAAATLSPLLIRSFLQREYSSVFLKSVALTACCLTVAYILLFLYLFKPWVSFAILFMLMSVFLEKNHALKFIFIGSLMAGWLLNKEVFNFLFVNVLTISIIFSILYTENWGEKSLNEKIYNLSFIGLFLLLPLSTPVLWGYVFSLLMAGTLAVQVFSKKKIYLNSQFLIMASMLMAISVDRLLYYW